MRRLVCAGEVVVDLVLAVPALPARGGDVVARPVTVAAGGATNLMVAARRQGAHVRYAGLLGTGPMGDLAAGALAAEGVEAVLPRRTGQDTATVVTLVEPDGERTFVTTLGAEADLRDEDLAAVEVGAHDVVYVSGYGLAYPANGPVLARWVPRLPGTVTVVLDPGPLVAAIPAAVLDPVLERVDWLSATVAEARLIAARLRPRAGRVLVVRDGPGDVTVTSERGDATVPAFDVTALDSNGAGDAHTGSLVAALLRADAGATDLDIVAVVRRANATAAITVTRPGPASAPTGDEVDAFLARRGGPRPTNG